MSRKRSNIPGPEDVRVEIASKKQTRLELLMGSTTATGTVPTAAETRTHYERFVAKVKEVLDQAECFQTSEGDPGNRARYNRDRNDTELWLYVQWETGGVSGGSCWDSSNPRSYSTNNAPEELVALDHILNALKPEITYIQYKMLANSVMKVDTHTENEYYGNCTNYAMKKVRVRDLFEYFRDQRWVLP